MILNKKANVGARNRINVISAGFSSHVYSKLNKMKQLLILFLFVTTHLVAQQIPDKDFRWTISKSHTALGKGAVVAIDKAHNNFHTLDGRFAAFGNLLRADGYIVKDFDSELTTQKLNNINILVISNSLNIRNANGDWSKPTPSAFTPGEISALNTWVKNGGSLLLIADHMPMPGAVLELAATFGITFENGFAFDSCKRPIEYFTKADKTLSNTVFTSKIDSVVNFTGSAFKVAGKVTPIITLDQHYNIQYPDTAWKFNATTKTVSAKGFLQLATVKYGKGKIVVSAEASMFSAQLAGKEKRPMGFNHPAAKYNCPLILNLFHWFDKK